MVYAIADEEPAARVKRRIKLLFMLDGCGCVGWDSMEM
jgi:hypothetical protein